MSFFPQKKREFSEKRKHKDDAVAPIKKAKTEDPTEVKDKKRKIKSEPEDSEEDKSKQDGREQKAKKKKKSQPEHAEDSDTTKDETVSKKDKKKKNKSLKQETEESNTEKEDEITTKKDKKKKKKDKLNVEPKSSEESDAIETDIYEDSDQVLTPRDAALIDMTDCTTDKHYKKRVVSLLKSINNRTRRLNKIDNKIAKFEAKGLNAENKRFHTAMHTEKLVIEERVKKLLEALQVAQEKLKEFGVEDKKEYKNKKKEKKIGKVDVEDAEKGTKGAKIEIKIAESLEPGLEAPSVKDFWSAKVDSVSKNEQDEESSSSEDEVSWTYISIQYI